MFSALRIIAVEKRPEPGGVIGFAQMGKFVKKNGILKSGGQKNQPPIQRQVSRA